jgi:polysaccharide chain length determinant protein (PEP-CTERM system associated)
VEIDFRYYLGRLRRKIWLVVVPALVVLAGAVAAVVLIPPLYRSSATILVESQQIPQDLVRSTVTAVANERIQVIEQRLMTRENLLRVVQKYKLFADQDMSATDLVDKMRKAATIDQVFLTTSKRGADSQAIAFTVAFEYPDPNTATQVANEFVTLILDEDLRGRTAQASEATRFLTAESERLGNELAKIETQIAQFKIEHKDALPETLEYRRSSLYRQQSDIAALDREIAGLGDERKLWQMRDASGSNPTDAAAMLAQARLALAAKRSMFTDAHPEVKRLTEQVKELEAAAMQPGSGDQTSGIGSPQIATIESRVKALQQQREEMQRNAEALEKSIGDTVSVEMGLATLIRQQEETQTAYRETSDKLSQAETGQRLEEDRQAEKFEVIEQPTVPTSPVWPNRPLLLALGVFASFGAGIAPLAATEIMNPGIRRSTDLETRFGRAPIITIPFIETAADLKRRKRRRRNVIVIAVVGCCLALVLVHFLVRPLDEVWYAITDRII